MKRTHPLLLAFHVAFLAFIVSPLLVVVLVSFTSKGYIAMPFDGASLRWYRDIAHHPGFIAAFWRSIELGTTAATLSVLLAVPAGLAIAWYRFPGRGALLGLLLSPLAVPPIVLGIGLLNFLTRIGAEDTMFSLIVAHVVVVLPYVVRLVVAGATGVDRTLGQAAQSLGASAWTAFRRVQLPMILPGVAGGWLIAFITSFDELSMTIFVASPRTQTLPVKMYAYIANTIDPLLASVSTVLMVMALVLMLLLERFYGVERVLGGSA